MGLKFLMLIGFLLAGLGPRPGVAALPDANLVLCGDGGWPDMPATLTIAAHRAALENQKPLSTQVLKWTPAGWEVVPP